MRSGAQKLSTFNLSTGGPTLDFLAPKLDIAIASIEKFVGQSFDVPKVWKPLGRTDAFDSLLQTVSGIPCRSLRMQHACSIH